VRPPSLPPTSLPKPTDPPPPDGGAVLRQRIVLLENALELARTTVEQQRDQLDALAAKLESLTATLAASDASREAKARELEDRARAEAEARAQALETRLAELEASIAGRALVDRLAEALAPRFDGGGSPELARLLLQLEARLRAVEEGSAEARLRIRLDRQGHRLDELEKRVPALETSERATSETLSESVARGAQHETRIARLESLFEELADEVREDREALGLAGFRARLDDVETLVLQAGTEEERLKKKLGEQEQTIAALREQLEQVERASLAPPPPSAPPGDDLTLIKGIGPKYARLLRELGVTSYAALAAWTEDDVERAAAHLGIPAARVRKAGWIEAAARLVAG
jgi:predicted flap endonuclease-1-like 5' DNA nuclease